MTGYTLTTDMGEGEGGLGLPSLEVLIPDAKAKMLIRLHESNDPVVQTVMELPC